MSRNLRDSLSGFCKMKMKDSITELIIHMYLSYFLNQQSSEQCTFEEMNVKNQSDITEIGVRVTYLWILKIIPWQVQFLKSLIILQAIFVETEKTACVYDVILFLQRTWVQFAAPTSLDISKLLAILSDSNFNSINFACFAGSTYPELEPLSAFRRQLYLRNDTGHSSQCAVALFSYP